ncbi:MAG: SCP2 sterol-binding domain-containing protein [Acidimicrobiales bacterium]|nr:SCP2 sterol-binding domain-containing protein [Acidimicrobiales bacterium]
MKFSETEWVSALNEALSGVFPEGTTDSIVVQYVIEESSGEFFTYYLSLFDGEASMREGKAEQANITFSLAEETAVQIQVESLSTEEAFLRGLLTVDGDVELLLKVHSQIEDSKA